MAQGDSADTARQAEPSVLLWLTNRGAAEITANSVASAGRAGLFGRYRLIVIHTDDMAGRVLHRYTPDARLVSLGELLGPGGAGIRLPQDYRLWGTQSFRLLSVFRYIGIKFALNRFRTRVIYTDGDIVYLRDPASYLNAEPALDRACVLAQSDRDVRRTGSPTHDPSPPGRFAQICSGFTVWRPLATHLQIVRTIITAMARSKGAVGDQYTFNRLPPAVLRHVQVLPEDRFVNGSLYFGELGDPAMRRQLDPIIVHANWMRGIDTKIEALKEAGLWYL
jgi:hypothetical protein